jgi:hypothetical protein
LFLRFKRDFKKNWNFFIFFQINIFLVFSNNFNVLISKMIFKKIKIYIILIYFQVKNILKSNWKERERERANWLERKTWRFRVCLAKRMRLRLLYNSGNIVFGYEISRDFYVWTLPLSALKTLFCWSRNYMLLLSRSCLSATSCAHHAN